MDLRFLRCNTCGNIIVFQNDAGPTPSCCGVKMQELKAGSEDGALEKHVPLVITEKSEFKEDNCNGTRFTKLGSCGCYVTVRVGKEPHVMSDDHYIQWITLETNCGVYTKFLDPGDNPEVTFCICKGEKPIEVFAYCNIHGLWSSAF